MLQHSFNSIKDYPQLGHILKQRITSTFNSIKDYQRVTKELEQDPGIVFQFHQGLSILKRYDYWFYLICFQFHQGLSIKMFPVTQDLLLKMNFQFHQGLS